MIINYYKELAWINVVIFVISPTPSISVRSHDQKVVRKKKKKAKNITWSKFIYRLKTVFTKVDSTKICKWGTSAPKAFLLNDLSKSWINLREEWPRHFRAWALKYFIRFLTSYLYEKTFSLYVSKFRNKLNAENYMSLQFSSIMSNFETTTF